MNKTKALQRDDNMQTNEYRAERACFRMCIDMIRYFRGLQQQAKAERWIEYARDHRDNLRRIRRTGHIAPF